VQGVPGGGPGVRQDRAVLRRREQGVRRARREQDVQGLPQEKLPVRAAQPVLPRVLVQGREVPALSSGSRRREKDTGNDNVRFDFIARPSEARFLEKSAAREEAILLLATQRFVPDVSSTSTNRKQR
jgi:hypothetical protein